MLIYRRFKLFLKISALGIAALPLFMLTGCGTSSSTSSSTGTGSVSGVVTDSSDNPVPGATVVAGNSSPTALTDENGRFTIPNLPNVVTPIKVILPGYNTNSPISLMISGDTVIGHHIHIPDVDDFGNAPVISNVSVTLTGTEFSVTADISGTTASSCGNNTAPCTIADARAELIGYGVGTALTNGGSGNVYTGNFALPTTFIGPDAIVKIFAVDDAGRVGAAVRVVPVAGSSGTGSYSAVSIAGNWGGNADFHRAGFWNLPGDKRNANLSFDLTAGGNTTGTFTGSSAMLDIEPYIPLKNWGIVTTSTSNGTYSLLDANLGIYQLTSSYTLSPNRTVTVKMTGRLDSPTSPTHFYGYFEAQVVDTTPYPNITIFGNFHLMSNLTWSASDLAQNWVWSQFVRSSSFAATTYKTPFQYNSAFTLDGSGNTTGSANDQTLFSATDSISATTAPFAFTNASLGVFHGTLFSTTDGSNTSMTGLMGPFKKHLVGMAVTTSGNQTAFENFWGSRIDTPPHYAITDFAELKYDGTYFDSIWRGFYVVKGGSHNGSACYLSLWIDPSGAIVGGRVLTISGTCPSATVFTTGSVSFSNTTDGEISGTATDTISGTSVSIAPSNSRNASMGVYKERLAGDFSITGGPDSGDSGYFFLGRTFIE